jgi:hypothetical protein
LTPKVPVDKTFRVFALDQDMVLPPSLDRPRWHQGAAQRVQTKAMSYARDDRQGEGPRRRGLGIVVGAERIDKGEDTKFGKNRRADELPDELRRRETRLAKIREAKAARENTPARGPVSRPKPKPANAATMRVPLLAKGPLPRGGGHRKADRGGHQRF